MKQGRALTEKQGEVKGHEIKLLARVEVKVLSSHLNIRPQRTLRALRDALHRIYVSPWRHAQPACQSTWSQTCAQYSSMPAISDPYRKT